MCKVDQEKEELLLLEYIKNFKMHYKLLLRRYRRYKEIYRIDNTDIDQITYFDMIIVQLRAMCIESPGLKDNFTVQNLFHRLGKEELVEKIDNMLDESLIGDGDFTIRKSLKTVADKLVCHYDYFDIRDGLLAISETIEANLQNPYVNENLDHIMNVLMSCVKEGIGCGFDDIGTEEDIRHQVFSWDM